MAVVGKIRSGKGGRITVGATNVTLAEWSLTRKGEDIDTVSFESLGEDQGTIGVTSTDYSVKGDWDAAQNRWESPPGFYPRDDLASVKLYENVTDNIFHSITQSRVLSAENGAQVRGKVTFSASCKSNGGVTLATGSV